MKNSNLFRKVLALLLVVTMLAGFVAPAEAVGGKRELRFELEQLDNSAVNAAPMNHMGSLEELTSTADPDEMVRVTIHLEKAPTIGAGFEMSGITTDSEAKLYREELRAQQDRLEKTIEGRILGGKQLDVVWNLTLAANLISANVRRGDIARIAELDGVRSVAIENCYAPDVVKVVM